MGFADETEVLFFCKIESLTNFGTFATKFVCSKQKDG